MTCLVRAPGGRTPRPRLVSAPGARTSVFHMKETGMEMNIFWNKNYLISCDNRVRDNIAK